MSAQGAALGTGEGGSVPFYQFFSPEGAKPNPRCTIPMPWGAWGTGVFRPFGA